MARFFGFIAVILILLTTTLGVIAEDISVGEQLLTDRGIAYGISHDASGKLYITDWKLGEVWRVDPGNGSYTLYRGLGSTLDSQPDPEGNIWLTSFWNPQFSRINASQNPVTLTTWDLSSWDPGRAYKLSGLAFDEHNQVWFSEWGESSDTQLLYRFDPTTNQLCGYTLPGGNHSWYLLYQDPYLWLGDWVQALIMRFNTETLEVTYWGAGSKAEPRGMETDEAGNLWWADVGTGKINRLTPATNSLISYALPNAGSPNYAVPYMLVVKDGKIYYSAQGDEVGTIGMLDPALADSSNTTTKRYSYSSVEICNNIPAGTTSTISTTAGSWLNPWPSRTWINATPPDLPGWAIFEAPGAEMPYGISVENNTLWLTDQMYNKLIRIGLPLVQPASTPTITQTKTMTPTPTNTLTPTNTQTPTPTATHTLTPTQTSTSTFTQTSSPTATATATPTATQTPTPTMSAIQHNFQIYLPIILTSNENGAMAAGIFNNTDKRPFINVFNFGILKTIDLLILEFKCFP